MAEPLSPKEVERLTRRLPRTFGAALKGNLNGWEHLFPSEQRRLLTQCRYLLDLPQPEFEKLFARIVALERKMALPALGAQSDGISVQESGLLARSPHYPAWRSEVERAFAAIDDNAKSATDLSSIPRVVIAALPPGVVLPQRLWPDLAPQGRWTSAADLPTLVQSLAKRQLPSGLEPIEATWVIEARKTLAPNPATSLDWDSLADLRKEFLRDLNSIRRSLDSVDTTTAKLKRLDIRRLLPASLAEDTRVREFIRGLLLSGNGALVFNNSFVQWGAAEALRRVQPQVLVAGFGIRLKIKPFSGSVLFEDQNTSNPVKDQDDPEGSGVDAMMLAGYVHHAAQRLAPHPKRTVTLLCAAGHPRALVLGPDSFRIHEPLPDALQHWLSGHA